MLWYPGAETKRYSMSYDANGNLVEKKEEHRDGGTTWVTDITWTYGWDIQDRLISVSKDVAGTETGDQKVEYAYCPSCGGAMRERIEYDNDTGGSIVSWLRYEYEGLNLLRIDQLYDGNFSGTIDSTDYTNKYWRPMNINLHGPGAIGQIIKSKWFSYEDDSTATPCTTGEYYYFYDAVGNVVGVWDQRDGAYHSWAMDAFGNPLSGVEFLAMAQPGPKEHLTGKMFDTVTGLYYFMARWLDPEVGRFVSRDVSRRIILNAEQRPCRSCDISTEFEAVLLEKTGQYHFCGNSPCNLIDQDGQLPILAIIAAYGVASVMGALGYGIEALTTYPDDQGFDDKFRHCWWICKLKAVLQSPCALNVGFYHELWNMVLQRFYGVPITQSLLDLMANREGSICGSWLRALLRWDIQSCEECCRCARERGYNTEGKHE